MQKRRKGIVAVMVPVLLLTGCMRSSMNNPEWKLRESIETSNLQGVKEATRDKKLDDIYEGIYESVDRDLARKFMVETLDASDESAAKENQFFRMLIF